jgi:hypothetical protein
MTLVLTEVSQAGIAMVADSAISPLRKGLIVTRDQQQWKKLLKVRRIQAGVSYWGGIGYITRERFDEWLERKIEQGTYKDLASFADYLATEMNNAARGKPIPQPAGIHVAGLHSWPDGSRRPSFFQSQWARSHPLEAL